MDIIQLYQDFSVTYQTEGHKHCRPGWINVECPWCSGNPGLHLGYNIEGNYFVCWRCGSQRVVPTIAKLINLPERETYFIVKKYGLLVPKLSKEPVVKIRVKAHRLPSNTSPLLPHHKKYLEFRNFDPDKLEREWKLLSTGPVSKLDNIDYKHRIIIPFIWNEQQVSFDSRDVTGKDPGRYKACPKDRELIPHKEIIYCNQQYLKDKIICVEGPTDVWRFGKNSGAVSGIKYTPKQVRILAKFKQVFIVFDPDPQALFQAEKLKAELKFRGIKTEVIKGLNTDPGQMLQNDADYLVKQLIH
jgi:hypothetical protein